MSAHKSRFFQHADSSVVRVSHPAYMRDYEEDPTVTEVQVVPLDAIVIDGPLPKVTRHDDGPYAVAGDPGRYYLSADDTPASLRESARLQTVRLLALADYLEQHPVVDEAQVKLLDGTLRGMVITKGGERISGYDTYDLAHRLVERGVRVEQA